MKIESLNIYFHGIMAWVFPYVKAGSKIGSWLISYFRFQSCLNIPSGLPRPHDVKKKGTVQFLFRTVPFTDSPPPDACQ